MMVTAIRFAINCELRNVLLMTNIYLTADLLIKLDTPKSTEPNLISYVRNNFIAIHIARNFKCIETRMKAELIEVPNTDNYFIMSQCGPSRSTLNEFRDCD
jgi:hypothetical protein